MAESTKSILGDVLRAGEHYQAKKRTILLLTTMALALILASGIALAASQLDQQQTSSNGEDHIDTDHQDYQTVTAGVSGQIDKISVYVGCCKDDSGNTGGTPPGDLQAYVYVPDSGQGGSGSVPASSFSTDGTLGWVDITLDLAPVAKAGQQYEIRVGSDNFGPPYYLWGNVTPGGYSGGNLYVCTFDEWGGFWSCSSRSDYDAAFKTYVTPDTTAPTVSSVHPSKGAKRVSRNANVTATFSEAMDPKTLTDPNTHASTTVQLFKGKRTTPVEATVSVSSDGKTVTLDPSVRLARGTTYTAKIKGGSSGVKDLAGNPLGQDYVWSFQTKN